MKKQQFQTMLIAMLCTLLTLGSCATQVEDMPSKPQQEVSDIQILQEFNESFTSEDATKGLTRPQWIKVGLQDLKWGWLGWQVGSALGSLAGPHGGAVGGTLGAVVVGGAASYVAYNDEKKKTRSTEIDVPEMQEAIAAFVLGENMVVPSDYLLGDSWGIEHDLLKVGILHNKALSKFGDITPHIMTIAVNELIDVEKAVINDPEFISLYGQLENRENVTFGWEEEYDTRATFSSTDAERIKKLFHDGIESSAKTQEDVNRFIGMYTATVNRSNTLTAEEKAELKCGFAIMGYSFAYWYEVWPYEDDDEIIL